MRPRPQPPLAPLRAILDRLELAGLPHAIGGSGLLAALGLVDRVNDWDVTVDADVEAVAHACAGFPFTRHGEQGGHADHKLVFEPSRVELIARFAFFGPRGVIRIPTRVTRRWLGLPIGSPAAWAVAYALMAECERDPRRRERAGLLFDWLGRHGADVASLAALAREPLPAPIRQRLETATARGRILGRV